MDAINRITIYCRWSSGSAVSGGLSRTSACRYGSGARTSWLDAGISRWIQDAYTVVGLLVPLRVLISRATYFLTETSRIYTGGIGRGLAIGS